MDQTLSEQELADPRFQPDDPDYAPWHKGSLCVGQFSFYSYSPPCTSFPPTTSTGVSIDGAWLHSVGTPTVTLALIGGSIDLTERDLAFKIQLNPGEIPALPERELDSNRDGVVTVHDFSSAPIGELPTPDTVTDARLLARSDRGDTNRNGFLDPSDLLLIFADDVDNDGNGLVDDIAGWNFLSHSPTPSQVEAPSLRTTIIARTAAARTNDNHGMAGSCPRCTILPIQVGDRGLASTNNLGFALLYAQSRKASVAIVATAIPGTTAFLEDVYAATAKQFTTILSAGVAEYPSRIPAIPTPSSSAAVLTISARDPLANNLACARTPDSDHLSVPGDTCPSLAAAGVVGGLAGLLRTIAPSTMSPSAVVSLLRATSSNGLINARAAMEAAVQGQQTINIRWISPESSVVIDPTTGPLNVQVRLENLPPEGANWYASITRETNPSDPPTAILTGVHQTDDGPILRFSLPVADLLPDPTRPPAKPQDKAFQLRLKVTTTAENFIESTRVQRVHLDADLDRLPGFPVALGAGAVGGPRIFDYNQDGYPEIWVALIDGRVVQVDHTGHILNIWSARAHSDPLPIESWASTLLPNPGIARLSSPTFIFDNGLPVVAVSAADGVLTLIHDTKTVEDHGTASDPTSGYPAGWISPAMGVRWMDTSSTPVTWLSPQGLQTLEERVWPLQLPQPAVAIDLRSPQGNTFWVVANNRLLNTQGLDVVLPNPQAQPRGLNQLRLRQSPILIGADTAPPNLVIPTRTGFATWNGSQFRSTPGPRDGHTLPGAPLSANGEEIVFWWVVDNELGQTPRPRPWSSTSDRVAFLADADPVPHEVLIADVDGATEEWIFTGDSSRLWAISENGKQAAGWPKLTGQPIWGTPAAGDLDGNETVELVAVTRGGWLHTWRTRGHIEDASWSSERHDLAATGNSTNDSIGRAPNASGCRSLPISSSTSPLGYGLGWIVTLISLWGVKRMSRILT